MQKGRRQFRIRRCSSLLPVSSKRAYKTQKATDKTLSIASDPSDSHTENRQYPYLSGMDIALFPDEISIRHLYAILCTMFHRYGLYRVQFPFKLACQIKVHDNSPLLKRSYYITMDWGCQFSVINARIYRLRASSHHDKIRTSTLWGN